ncbi:hypothetical protein EGY05_16760 [Chryseobacterium arthrosphaerae]|uniref:Uncharacterized protein n=1 Tax=Chryseobacterium arthrosphaerae TaxID=651561 RepID=A0A1B8ZTZ4_9FLAO|nr:hypothetical protein EGY05_16760 [Chryseobacterium arthrosphaerae]OCA75056.1 hypothetical protein BBI00_12240 [Chryseobacterium arthrosphaerae]
MINISISVFKIKYSCITPTFHMTRLYKDKVFLSYPDIRALFLSISVLIPDESLNLPYIKIEK